MSDSPFRGFGPKRKVMYEKTLSEVKQELSTGDKDSATPAENVGVLKKVLGMVEDIAAAVREEGLGIQGNDPRLSSVERATLESFSSMSGACALECASLNGLIEMLENLKGLTPDQKTGVTMFKIQHGLVRKVWALEVEKFEKEVRQPLEKLLDLRSPPSPPVT